jgi:hypothetical protein
MVLWRCGSSTFILASCLCLKRANSFVSAPQLFLYTLVLLLQLLQPIVDGTALSLAFLQLSEVVLAMLLLFSLLG